MIERTSELGAWELKTLLESGAVTSEQLLSEVLDSIHSKEETIKAYISIRAEERLRSEARSIDQRRSRGEPLGALAGLPIAIKDNIAVSGERLTCGSRFLANFVSPYDATAVERIRAADAIIVGKTNMDEFGMGSSTENSAMHVTRNPRSIDRVPGGTSGGSAAALAAGEAVLALGSDTGGSIRQPACLCGVVGLKPTYGLVSRYGLVAYASSLEQIGPICRNVRDAAWLLELIAGSDPRDSTSVQRHADGYVDELDGIKDDFVVGLPKEYFGPGLHPEMRHSIEHSIHLLEREGCKVIELSMPHTDLAIASYYVIASAEASSNLARYDGVRFGVRAQGATTVDEMVTRSRTQGFGAEVQRRIILGTYVLSAGYYDAYYTKAQKVRRLVQQDFKEAFRVCDALIHPVSPTPAWKIGEKTSDPLQMYLSDIYSITASLAGVPGISVPCGETRDGLPLGLQITADHFCETRMLQLASRLERVLANLA